MKAGLGADQQIGAGILYPEGASGHYEAAAIGQELGGA